MSKLLLNIYLWVMLVLVTLLTIILFPLLILFYISFFGRSLDAAIRFGIGLYGWVLVKAVPFFAPVQVEYQTEKLTQPAIFVANHNSAIDPYVFGALLVNASFVTTWPFKIPVYGLFMRLAKYINAEEGWEQVSEKCAELLCSGTSVIIWPEGHRSRDGRLGRFKNGAFAVSVETGYPIQPVCIIGSRQFLPPDQALISPSRVKLIILAPVFPDSRNDHEEEIIRLRVRVKEAIQKTLQEHEENLMQEEAQSEQYERGLKC